MLACLLAPVSHQAKEPLGRAQFTEHVAGQLRKAVPGLTVTVIRDLELRAVTKDQRESTVFLDNAYAELAHDPDDLDAIVARHVASAKETMGRKAPQVRRDRIVPVIKDRGWLEEVRRSLRERGARKELAQVWEEYNSELVIVYAEDSPKNIRYLGEDDLRALGLSRGELRPLAIRNLLSILPKIELHGQGGLYMMTAGGDYEASLILADRIWDGGEVKVDGDVVVAIPARDVLLICGSRDSPAIAKVREIAARTAKEAPYRLTAALLVRRNGKFQRLSPRALRARRRRFRLTLRGSPAPASMRRSGMSHTSATAT